ncbi:MAG TPA: helix-turn-helix domain-containing protein [Dissulfurispiraceae bacterium]
MQIVDIKKLSEIIHVKVKTIYQWAELKQIPHIRLNGSLRFDLDDINRWVQDCKIQAQTGYNPLVQTRSPRKGGSQ